MENISNAQVDIGADKTEQYSLATMFYAFPAWRFRSTWLSIIVHSAQSVFFSFLILGVVLGLA